MDLWITIGIVWFAVTILALLVVCNGLNWNDDERQAEAEGLSYGSGQGSEHNGTARPWPDDSVSARDDDHHRTTLGTDGGGSR